jgi:hypothetical protein
MRKAEECRLNATSLHYQAECNEDHLLAVNFSSRRMPQVPALKPSDLS